MNRNITFTIGEEFVPIIETTPEQIHNSLFREIYDKAFYGINDFLNDRKKSPNEKEVNNIFAFIGERGSGKSSCMQSMAHILSNKELCCQIFGIHTKIHDTPFEKVDTIDPGMFEANNNILQLVVGKLFRKFKSDVEEENPKDDARLRAKRELIICFEKIYQNIRILFNQANTDSESLDALLDLAASYDLKENFRKLIDLYLEWNDKKDGALILQIDDIDLQTRYAYDMVEQIRKYMMHPNIIILMAVRLSQLEEVITRQYVEEFQSLLGSNGYMAKEAPEEMSERYLGKLIPLDRRLFLPELENLFTFSLTIIDPDAGKKEFHSVRHAVLELIFQKTRFLFYDTKGFTSYIVPRNLRELRSLIRLLYKMPEFRFKDEHGEIREHTYNQTLFQKYFFDTWLQNNLDKPSIELLQNIWDAEIIVKNKLVIDYFRAYFDKDNKIQSFIAQLIPSSNNKAYDISMGDVLGLLDMLETYSVIPKTQKLIFAIRTIYSMLLYHYYNEYNNRQRKNNEVLKTEILEDLPAYLRLVGGAFVNSELYNLLPLEQSGHSRTRRNINIQPLLESVCNILRNAAQPEKIKDPDDLAQLHLLEFTLLNIIARDESHAKKVDLQSINNPSYIFRVTPKSKYFQFDILGCTYNLIQYRRLYARYLSLFGLTDTTEKRRWRHYLVKHKSSLHFRFKSIAATEERYNSKICFRNCEVINAFVWFMLQHRPEGTNDHLSLYKAFYRHIGKFQIDTYGNSNINFSFFQQIEEILATISEEQTPKAYALFNNTFFPKQTLDIGIKLNSGSKNAYNTLLRKLQENNSIDVEELFKHVFSERRPYSAAEARKLLKEMQRRYEDLTAENNG